MIYGNHSTPIASISIQSQISDIRIGFRVNYKHSFFLQLGCFEILLRHYSDRWGLLSELLTSCF